MRKIWDRVLRLLVVGVPLSVPSGHLGLGNAHASSLHAIAIRSVTCSEMCGGFEPGTEEPYEFAEIFERPFAPPRSSPGETMDDTSAFTEPASSRSYVLRTARPGDTMTRQGPELSIARLHPDFVIRLANTIRQARREGLSSAGIFSAYRPPGFGVGGFADKYMSMHSYGLAVDVQGIGGPGSEEAQRWHHIAAANGIFCPYGPHNHSEWNHCQALPLKAVSVSNPLRATITDSGPADLDEMFRAGTVLMARVAAMADTAELSIGASPRLKPVTLFAAQDGSKGATHASRKELAQTEPRLLAAIAKGVDHKDLIHKLDRRKDSQKGNDVKNKRAEMAKLVHQIPHSLRIYAEEGSSESKGKRYAAARSAHRVKATRHT